MICLLVFYGVMIINYNIYFIIIVILYIFKYYYLIFFFKKLKKIDKFIL